jgi:hypothetical protein
VAGTSLPPAAYRAAGAAAAAALAGDPWRCDERTLRVLLDNLRLGGSEGEDGQAVAGG